MFVTAKPLWFLRADGLTLFAASVALFTATGQRWWLYPALLFVPDLSMVGYLRDSRLGALAYNVGHSYAAPAITAGAGWLASSHLTIAIGVIWLGHIGFDRALGYGLKYDTAFSLTHLGEIGGHERHAPPAPRG